MSDTAPVRALTISPYPSMGVVLSQVASNMQGILLDIREGDLEEAIDLVNQLDQSRYDVIISRGGTAKMLQDYTSLPVVEVKISVYDMLRSIKLAENYQDGYAIVGFENITESAHVLCDLLQKSMKIITLRSSGEVESVLAGLRADGCRLVICDMVTYHRALELGLDAYLITSGVESAREALAEAEVRGRRFHGLRARISLQEAMIAGSDTKPFVLSREGERLYPEGGQPDEELTAACSARLAELSRAGAVSFYHQGKNGLSWVTGRTIQTEGGPAYLFQSVGGTAPHKGTTNGIHTFQRAECEDFLKGQFLNIPGLMDDVRNRLRQAAASDRPVVLVGETGTGLPQAVRQLYLDSALKNRPLVLIDCPRLSERGWDFLFRHSMSPLNRTGITLWIDHLEELPQARAEDLFGVLFQTAASRRVRLLFTLTLRRDKPTPAYFSPLLSQLSCMNVILPALRARAEEIPFLATLCLNYLNLKNGFQISGLDSQAAEQLRRYDWPNNMEQFFQALGELAATASGSYIRSGAVSELLQVYSHKMRGLSFGNSAGIPWKDRTLEEISRDAIHTVLTDLDGNQSRAARTLGISRATLWRVLKEEPGKPGKK